MSKFLLGAFLFSAAISQSLASDRNLMTEENQQEHVQPNANSAKKTYAHKLKKGKRNWKQYSHYLGVSRLGESEVVMVLPHSLGALEFRYGAGNAVSFGEAIAGQKLKASPTDNSQFLIDYIEKRVAKEYYSGSLAHLYDVSIPSKFVQSS